MGPVLLPDYYILSKEVKSQHLLDCTKIWKSSKTKRNTVAGGSTAPYHTALHRVRMDGMDVRLI